MGFSCLVWSRLERARIAQELHSPDERTASLGEALADVPNDLVPNCKTKRIILCFGHGPADDDFFNL
jgi:hypothetical protein